MIRTRTDIIQSLINKYNFASYLEIGVQDSVNNFDKIKCSIKVGVDPDTEAKGVTHRMTSDEYFNNNWTLGVPHLRAAKFDIIFIDGLHEAYQVEKDIINSLDCLNEGGFIICHDMNPPSELHQRVPRETKQWNGDVWRAWVKLRERIDLYMFVIDCDWGCGVIKRGGQEPLGRKEELIYDNMAKNREQWLNLVSSEWFEKMYL